MKITIEFEVPTSEMRRRFDGDTWTDQTELEYLRSFADTRFKTFCLQAGKAVKEEIEKL